MIKTSFNRLQRRMLRSRGFTLLELTMVLLIASVIIGAIWVAAEHVWEDYRASRVAQQVTKVTQNIRDYYLNAQSLPAPVGDKTVVMDGAGIFPLEMRRTPSGGPGGPIDHPFNNTLAGGSFYVFSLKCTNGTPLTSTCFRVRVEGLEPAPCIRLLQAIPVTDADMGIVAVGTKNAAPLVNTAGTTITMPAAITASQAEGLCNNVGATNEVDWDFKLHN